MLYIDTSALAKRYIAESGSAAVHSRLHRAVEIGERICTSVLTYAETLTLFGRRYQAREFKPEEFRKATDDFLHDWQFGLNTLELDTRTMSSLPDLTARYPLKSADAIHLSAALWLRDSSRFLPELTSGRPIEFVAADQALARIAAECGLTVFNPEAHAS